MELHSEFRCQFVLSSRPQRAEGLIFELAKIISISSEAEHVFQQTKKLLRSGEIQRIWFDERIEATNE